jgi:hypothetical protein
MSRGISDEDRQALHALWRDAQLTQPSRPRKPLMTWRSPRLPKVAHVVLMLAVGAIVTATGAHLIGQLIASTPLALGLGLFWGVIVGCACTGYWAEVIDR